MGIGGFGTLAGKIAEQFQSRMERNKNEYDKLIKEKSDIMRLPQNDSNTKRLDAINRRIDELEQFFKNNAKD